MDNSSSLMLKKPIRLLKGVGEARAGLFEKLGIFTLEDIITFYPREYEDRRNIVEIKDIKDEEFCTFKARILSAVSESRPRRNLTIQKVKVKDNYSMATLVWFNQSYVKNTLTEGKEYIFYGRAEIKYGSVQIQNPVFEKYDPGIKSSLCTIAPVYPLTARLTQNIMRKTIEKALEIIDCGLDEILPFNIRKEHKLCEINYAVKNIHFPEDEESLKNSRHRLIFEELFILQLGLMLVKKSYGSDHAGIPFTRDGRLDAFIKKLPFKLTGAQARVFKEIEKDMESSNPMSRLVQGDVGSGKTILAILAMLKAYYSGYQSAMMIPTEILSEQHFCTVTKFLKGEGVNVVLLTGSMKKTEREEALKLIAEGRADITVGTHALIQKGVAFKKLGLVITDEQHRFGVRQREVLKEKGITPDVLVMTATPIPRTLAMIVYGDLDISAVDELPPGRKPVETYVVDDSMRERINRFIRKKVGEGRQVYIVCPLVDESETIEANSAVKLEEQIAKREFSDLKVELVHGKMKAGRKEKVMKEFTEGNIDILVSTTVIEVGVNVQNATVMVVENSERFGLAQLHQLRGRVGRGEHQSYCILYNMGKSKVAKERMNVMQKTGDGFVIAEKDLEIRGPGEFFGTRQHGIPDLKIANLYRDVEILKETRRTALEILQEDKDLSESQNRKIGEFIKKLVCDREDG